MTAKTRLVDAVKAVVNPVTGRITSLSSGGDSENLPRVLYKNYSGLSNTTATGVEQILAAILIPAGTIVAPASLRMSFSGTIIAGATAGNRLISWKLNTSGVLAGATLLSSSITTSTSATTMYSRNGTDEIVFPTSTTQIAFPRGSGMNTNNTTGNPYTGTLDTASDMYLLLCSTILTGDTSFTISSTKVVLEF